MIDRTLISHFYNEEYLLPWWLKHHREIFKDGVMIDYGSTDRSIDIIKELCPTWKIVPTKNKFFGAQEIDEEIMPMEREIEGWRIVLNTTEFLLGNFSKLDEMVDAKIAMMTLVDPSSRDGEHPDVDQPLTAQRFNGADPYSGDNFRLKRARILHRDKNYKYPIGRHIEEYNTKEFMIVRFDYAPWNEEMLRRKTQIGAKQPQTDIDRGWGMHHKFDAAQHENTKNELLARSSDMEHVIKSFEYWRYT